MIIRTNTPKPVTPLSAPDTVGIIAPLGLLSDDLALSPKTVASPNPSTMMMIVHHNGDLVVVILIRSALRTAITVHLP
ncbi:Uncharacterised protein [Mycobacteroides abscessus subsp. abscessus]|nr:Uncharacterised protein [Mycobacteroides abscessus subsp. abscessus]